MVNIGSLRKQLTRLAPSTTPQAVERRPLTGAFLVFSAPASAQEFSLLAGPLFSDSANTYSWSASYREGLGRFAAWSFSWINEGHIPEHHRDGQTIQAWGRLPIWNDRLELQYRRRYFDTTVAGSGGDYSNTHGWGVLWSVRAAYYFDHRWIAQAQLNHIQVFGGPDTTALPFGIGYELEAKGRPGPWERAVPRTSKVTNNEVTIMLGKTTAEQRQLRVGQCRKPRIQARVVALCRCDPLIHP